MHRISHLYLLVAFALMSRYGVVAFGESKEVKVKSSSTKTSVLRPRDGVKKPRRFLSTDADHFNPDPNSTTSSSLHSTRLSIKSSDGGNVTNFINGGAAVTTTTTTSSIRQIRSGGAAKSFVVAQKKTPIPLYIPNILCYMRIIISFLSLYTSSLAVQRRMTLVNRNIDSVGNDGGGASTSAMTISGDTNLRIYCFITFGMWIFASFLDNIDGKIARKLNQCSELGIILDIAGDNMLRSSSWISCTIMAVAMTMTKTKNNRNCSVCSLHLPLMALGTTSMEWMTMLSTQLLTSYGDRTYWKDLNDTSSIPWLVECIFQNNFRNPLGIITLYGSMGCGMVHFGHMNRDVAIAVFSSFILPSCCRSGDWDWVFGILLDVARYLAYLGRVLALYAEGWFCVDFCRTIVRIDEV